MTAPAWIIDETTASEVEAALALRDGGLETEPPPWEPSDEDEDLVERYLRGLRFYRGEVAEILAKAQDEIDLAKAEIARIEAWREKALRSPHGSVDYLTARLQQFSESVGHKRRKSPNGTIGWRKGRKRVEILADDFCDQHADEPWVRWKAEPDKKAIMDHIKETGEIPEGADLVTAPDTFVIDTPEED